MNVKNENLHQFLINHLRFNYISFLSCTIFSISSTIKADVYQIKILVDFELSATTYVVVVFKMFLFGTFPLLAIFAILLHNPICISSQTVESSQIQFTGEIIVANVDAIVGPDTLAKNGKDMLKKILPPLPVFKRSLISLLRLKRYP